MTEEPPRRVSSSYARQLFLLLLALVPVSGVLAWRMPVTYPEGDFILNVLDVAKTGHVSSTFTPDTYPYLAGIAYKAAGVHGFLLEQVTEYLLFGAALLWLVRLLAGGTQAALVSAALICLHPDLLSSIPRVWDTELTSLLLIAFAGACILTYRRPSLVPLLALATVWGVGLSVRPNFALFLLPVIYLLLLAREKRWPVQAAGVTAAAVLICLCTNRLAHGSFYLPQNGPYNLFAGANLFTRAALLRLFNAESSVPLALASMGLHARYTYDPALNPTYLRQALLFLGNHPLQWLWLCVIKLLTLLRANTKSHPLLTPGWLVQVATTVCVPIWLATLALLRRLTPADKLVLLIAVSYILPFLLTNSDPRFRPPLDLLVLAHAASLLMRRFAGLHEQSAEGRGNFAAQGQLSERSQAV